jgi:hypothetical protein
MRKFFRTLIERYPGCWFVYKIEWTHEAGLHLHLLGELLTAPLQKMYREEARLEELWADACRKEKIKSHSVVTTTAVEAHRSYLTTSDKLNDDIELMKRLNGRNIFGKVNPDNIRYHDVDEGILDEEEGYDLALALIEKNKDKANTVYYAKQALHKHGAIRGLDKEVLNSLYDDIKDDEDDVYISTRSYEDDDSDLAAANRAKARVAVKTRMAAKKAVLEAIVAKDNAEKAQKWNRSRPIARGFSSDVPDDDLDDEDDKFCPQAELVRANREKGEVAAQMYAKAAEKRSKKTAPRKRKQ